MKNWLKEFWNGLTGYPVSSVEPVAFTLPIDVGEMITLARLCDVDMEVLHRIEGKIDLLLKERQE